MKCCAVPAVNTPAGRVPWIKTCFALLSRQPVARTRLLAVTVRSPSRDTRVTAKPLSVFSGASDEGIAGRFDIRLRYLIHEALNILGACKALAEAAQAEAVVYALLEHSAKALLALNDEHSRAVFVCRKCGRKAAGPPPITITS